MGGTLGAGGLGGGGGAGDPATNGTANTGGGGGGNLNNTGDLGGTGGSGIVIISAPTSESITATGGTHTVSGGNDIWKFTSSGTWTPTTGGTSSGYSYYRAITVSSNTSIASGTNANFPMLFSGTYSWLEPTSNGGRIQNLTTAPNGSQEPADLIFTTSAPTQSGNVWNCGTSLNFETESYSSSTGAINDWVNIPSLAAGQVIYSCYGNSIITTDQSHPSSTWNSSYAGVWHLANGTTLSGFDSTINGNNGTVTGATATTGQIDGGGNFVATDNPTIIAPNASSLNITSQITVEGWIYWTSLYYGWSNAIAKTANGDSTGYGFYTYGSGSQMDFQVGGSQLISTTGLSFNTWYHIVGTYDGTSMIIYLNGVPNTTTPKTGSIPTNTYPFYISDNESNGGDYWNGKIDEVRISNTARSSSWILTEYNNQNSPSTFYAVGSEQGAATPTAPTAPGSFTVGSPTTSTISLSWASSTPNNGATISFYAIHRGTSTSTMPQVATTSALTLTNASLTASTTYYYYVTAQDSVGNISASSSVASGTTTSSHASTVGVLVVAGGGGGGEYAGGAGGAGGVLYDASHTVTATTYTVTVGAGGPGANSGGGTSGNNSVFDTITANGGGGGGGNDGVSGGSGGGGGSFSGAGGAGTAGQGHNGGAATGANGGGGGGAGSVGASTGGNGGSGLAYSISGSSVYYGGGGGGSDDAGSPGTGGIGGGGTGAGIDYSNGVSGTANTGGGGGGTWYGAYGGNGGSGIVIISAVIGVVSNPTTAGGTHTTNSGNDIWTFTSSGTWTPTFGGSGSSPTITSFGALPTVVASAGTSTLSWNITNASSVAITPGTLSTSTLIGSWTVNPTSTTVYTITATNANGTSTATTSVSVSGASTTYSISSSSTAHWAWNDEIGWIDFYTTNTVTVTPTQLTGYASSSVGPVSLDCATSPSGNICGTSNYKVANDGSGNLSGWAWNDKVGWISFYWGNASANPTATTTALCQSYGSNYCGVQFNPTTGIFSGWAWNDDIGWISFNCSNTSSCYTSQFDVVTALGNSSSTGAVGTLDSETLDTGVTSGAEINSVTWQGNQPPGTLVGFQFAVSNSSSGPWNFTGPDGTSGTMYVGLADAPIPLSNYSSLSGRYFRYRIILSTNAAQTVSPRVQGVDVNWSP
jgi:hypothetical protein